MIFTIEAAKIGPLLLRLMERPGPIASVFYVASQHDAAPHVVAVTHPTRDRAHGERQFERVVERVRAKAGECFT